MQRKKNININDKQQSNQSREYGGRNQYRSKEEKESYEDKKDKDMAKYSEAASETVGSAVKRMKKGTLRSGSGAKVKSRKQAIAIGISEAREKGMKVPKRKTG